jgi:hypothetical protein
MIKIISETLKRQIDEYNFKTGYDKWTPEEKEKAFEEAMKEVSAFKSAHEYDLSREYICVRKGCN